MVWMGISSLHRLFLDDLTGPEAQLPNHLTARLAACFVVVLPLAAHAQDRRTVTEPTFPVACSVLAAQLQIVNGEPSSETAFDTSRIQAALNAAVTACPGKAVELTTSGANAAFLIQPLSIPGG